MLYRVLSYMLTDVEPLFVKKVFQETFDLLWSANDHDYRPSSPGAGIQEKTTGRWLQELKFKSTTINETRPLQLTLIFAHGKPKNFAMS